METYNYEDPVVTPGFGQEGDVTPSLPSGGGSTTSPSFSPSTNLTPAFPAGGSSTTSPSFSPSTSLTPAFPAGGNSTLPPGFSPSTNLTPAFPAGGGPTVSPGFGPSGNVTPSIPSTGGPIVSPGFGPGGNVTPSLPTSPSTCINCTGGAVVRPGNGNILWTWGTLSPFFSTSSSIAHVRFYNAAALQEPLDLYLNGRLVVSNLEYMNITNYLHIVPGVYRFSAYRSTNPGGYPIIDTGVQFRGGNSYTLTVLGTVNNFSVQLITS